MSPSVPSILKFQRSLPSFPGKQGTQEVLAGIGDHPGGAGDLGKGERQNPELERAPEQTAADREIER